MHGINLGQVSPEGPPCPHLNPSDGFHVGSGLDEGGVAGSFSGILMDQGYQMEGRNQVKLTLMLFLRVSASCLRMSSSFILLSITISLADCPEKQSLSRLMR